MVQVQEHVSLGRYVGHEVLMHAHQHAFVILPYTQCIRIASACLMGRYMKVPEQGYSWE